MGKTPHWKFAVDCAILSSSGDITILQRGSSTHLQMMSAAGHPFSSVATSAREEALSAVSVSGARRSRRFNVLQASRLGVLRAAWLRMLKRAEARAPSPNRVKLDKIGGCGWTEPAKAGF